MLTIEAANVPTEVLWQLNQLGVYIAADRLGVFGELLFQKIASFETLPSGFERWIGYAPDIEAIVWQGYYITATGTTVLSAPESDHYPKALRITQ